MLDRTFAFMGNAEQHLDATAGPGAPVLHLLFPGDPHSVRRALKTAMEVFRTMALGQNLDGVVEIVLAEALNNVVEHAYEDLGRGVVELVVRRTPNALTFHIRDDGRPLPREEIPAGRAHDLDVATDDLPEGGFGWFLIRELTANLRYRRHGTRNTLTFEIPLAPIRPRD